MHKRNIVLAATLVALESHAGGMFEMSEPGASTVVQTIAVQDGKLRIDSRGIAGAPPTTMIFAEETLTIVDDAAQSYYRITAADLEQLGSAMSQASAMLEQMRSQLESLPPEQREMMERMMRDRMPDLGAATEPAAAVRLEPRGRDTVAGYECTQYEVYVGDALTQALCAADYERVPGADEIEDMLERMQRFFAGFRDAMPAGVAGMRGNPFDAMSRIGGIPVRSRIYVNGNVQQELVLSSAESRDIEPSRFDVPAGYTEQNLMPRDNPFR